MKFVTVIMTFGFGAIFAVKADQCVMANFYQEIGCTPVPTCNTTGCPLAYNCPTYPDITKCYYKGSTYSEGDALPDSVIDHPCSLSCYCGKDIEGVRFSCAAIDCMFFATEEERLNCIYTQDLTSCCSTGFVCGKDEIAKLKTCDVDGTTYREGQSFYPTNSHKKCICTDQWNGSIDDPRYCKDINCGLEIYNQDNLRNRCAAVFISSRRTCPIYFICPSNSTHIVRQVKRCNGGSKRRNRPQCLFGNASLNIGDHVLVDDQCTTCSCAVPPFVTCIKESNCDS